jgi:hypothetical protein
MKLLQVNQVGQLELTEAGGYLTLSNPLNLVGYNGLDKEDPGVLQMVEWLQNDGPADSTVGVSFVKDEEAPSPMDEPSLARYYTMALAGRARILSPIVATKMTKRPGVLLDVAGGTGYYSYEWLKANPGGNAILFDRPEVLKVAAECAADFCKANPAGTETLLQRLTFLPGDMLTDDLPAANFVLAGSVFHDWPVTTCRHLAQKFALALRAGGELWIHDSFLDDTLDGPIAVTDYSAMLFLGTKGRAYSRKEHLGWLTEAGLLPGAENFATAMDYGLISARKE